MEPTVPSAAAYRQDVERDITVASKDQMTGVRGGYLVAAELTRCGFIVSPTSRSAFGRERVA
jgi:hypothetical protein